MRPLKVTPHIFSYADGSVLIELGNTKVLCAATLQKGVPPFLRGSGTGWLTAEYAMLPTATQTRIQRESSSHKRSGRSVEISRFIGRSLRTMIDLAAIGELTITVDCDVLQADGSTRTAAITGASYALMLAEEQWLSTGIIHNKIVKEPVGALSIGRVEQEWLVDLDYTEDSNAEADFNVVITQSGKIIEVQGCAEKAPISWDELSGMHQLVESARPNLFSVCEVEKKQNVGNVKSSKPKREERAPFFSLKNRQIQS